MLGFWGQKTEPGELRKELYRPDLKGSLPVDLLLAAQARGMSAEMLDGDLERLKRELDAGHPLIAFVNQGYRFLPIGHYLVVVGYDDASRTLYAHSGMKKNAAMTYEAFTHQWEKTDRWTLLLLPAGR